MTTSTEPLDAAFDRLGRWGFDDPDGYVNHGPMVCEALDVLGRPTEVDSWSRLDVGTPPAGAIAPRRFVWTEAIGDANRAGEWMGYFERAIADDGWEPVLREWLPRLLPGMGTALFHGAIRCAHAVRAIETADTPARRAELVRGLGYWAAVYQTALPSDAVAMHRVDDVHLQVVHAAGDAARHYLAKPTIIHLHGITAAMSVSILVRHVDPSAAATALAHLASEHAALYAGTDPIDAASATDVDAAMMIDAAIASGDAHAVKLVEACQRGFVVSGDPVFLAAAERVTRRGRRLLTSPESRQTFPGVVDSP